jgi:hypothetical protein
MTGLNSTTRMSGGSALDAGAANMQKAARIGDEQPKPPGNTRAIAGGLGCNRPARMLGSTLNG